MQLQPDDLAAHLERKLAPIYLIHGDEPLTALEAGDAIRTAARRAGCDEREIFIVEQHFRWEGFVAANANIGLFASRRLIDLRIPSGKPGVEGAGVLEGYAKHPAADNVLLVTLPRLDRAAQSSAWFSALASAGVSVAVQPLDRAALPAWIAARLGRSGQRASRDTLALLAERCEGNLLAANQEIQKLALVLPQGDLAQDDVERAIADVARYDVFGLSEAWLAGDAPRALRIIAALRAEGEPITLAVWQLGEDLHALSAVHEATLRGMPLQSAVRSVRVWGRRQAALERAAGRLSLRQCELQLRSLARLDALAKGLGQGDSWSALSAAALALCGLPALAGR